MVANLISAISSMELYNPKSIYFLIVDGTLIPYLIAAIIIMKQIRFNDAKKVIWKEYFEICILNYYSDH